MWSRGFMRLIKNISAVTIPMLTRLIRVVTLQEASTHEFARPLSEVVV